MTAKEEFTAWYNNQVKNHGLLKMSVVPNYTNSDRCNTTEEELCAELMRMINAPDCEDKKVLCKYSI